MAGLCFWDFRLSLLFHDNMAERNRLRVHGRRRALMSCDQDVELSTKAALFPCSSMPVITDSHAHLICELG